MTSPPRSKRSRIHSAGVQISRMKLSFVDLPLETQKEIVNNVSDLSPLLQLFL